MSRRQSIVVDEAFCRRATTLIFDLWDEVCGNESAYTTCKMNDAIDIVLNSKVLTWRYVLMTQLLGKATDEHVNLLAMHKASKLKGAWDARALCEKVISSNDGFEAAVFNGAIARSKQPYNNGFAKHYTLSKKREGVHKSCYPINDALVDGFKTIKNSEEAKECLGYLLRSLHTMVKQATADSLDETIANHNPINASRFRTFLIDIANKGHNGEGLGIATTLALSTVFKEDNIYNVNLYPVNSSRCHDGEHEDIEIFYGDMKYAAIELKDKPFASSDVLTAAKKAWDSGFPRFGFIYGNGAGVIDYEVIPASNRTEQEKHHVFAVCLSFEQFVDALLLCNIDEIDYEQVRVSTLQILEEAEVKHRTLSIVRQLLLDFINTESR